MMKSESVSAPKTPEWLEGIGFVNSAQWGPGRLGYAECKGNIAKGPGLYAFVVGRCIVYVGRSTRCVMKRVRSYERSQRKGADSRHVHRALHEAVDARKTVDVYVLTIAKQVVKVRGLPVSVVTGAETAIIDIVDPLWNRPRNRLQ